MIDSSKRLVELMEFRSLMGLNVSSNDVKRIWGRRFFKNESKKTEKESVNTHAENKIKIAKAGISKLLLFDWVKFIGVSGSVAAGFAKEEDDIDLFIVVKNNCMWLYRGIISLRNIFHRKIRTKKDSDVKDKLCINLISEERGVGFSSDIFNFHELMYLKPIYNEKYLSYIYWRNEWLRSDYGIKKELTQTKISSTKNVSIFFSLFNSLAFFLQLFFMIISNHNPEVERLKNNSRNGRIEFFSTKHKEKVVSNYLERFKSIN
jgi:predicted nucleotidyltransferase